MSKKDRIAIAISIIMLLIAFPFLFDNKGGIIISFFIIFLLVIYWLIRFIKNYISFIDFEKYEKDKKYK